MQKGLIKTRGIPIMPAIPGLPFTQGDIWHVKPSSGSNSNYGDHPSSAFKTLAYALDKATANQNDIVLLYAESNTAASTTDYQSSTLDWNKDMVHLIGVNAGQALSQRSRVALISTYDTASNLITVSADCCRIQGVEFFAGVAGTNPTGCMKITGSRNNFVNCHIAGIGNDANDIAGAYSLWFYDASENKFEGCVIGTATIKRGSAANAEILFTTAAGVGSARTIFKDCLVVGWCESAGNYLFVSANQAGALCEYLLFDNTPMINTSMKTGGATMTQAMQIHASANGWVVFQQPCIIGAGNVNASDTGLVIMGAGSIPNNAEVTDLGIGLVTTNA